MESEKTTTDTHKTFEYVLITLLLLILIGFTVYGMYQNYQLKDRISELESAEQNDTHMSTSTESDLDSEKGFQGSSKEELDAILSNTDDSNPGLSEEELQIRLNQLVVQNGEETRPLTEEEMQVLMKELQEETSSGETPAAGP